MLLEIEPFSSPPLKQQHVLKTTYNTQTKSHSFPSLKHPIQAAQTDRAVKPAEGQRANGQTFPAWDAANRTLHPPKP